MKKPSNQTGFAIWFLVVAALAACSPVQAPTLATSANPASAMLTRLLEAPTSVPAPTASLAPVSAVPSPTYTPEMNPASSPEPAFTPASTVNFRSIRMIDIQKGWAIADLGAQRRSHVLRTTDGGATWEELGPEIVP